MKKCLITCWFGKIPDYYKVWEDSCSYNNDYTFLFFTDQTIETKYENIKIYHIKMSKLIKLIENKLSLRISIKKPYKLCDFRPAYGIIFEDYIKDYDFWGHCDIDQVWGKISNFITDDILDKYDKINRNGPFTLYRNSKEVNNMYKLSGGKFNYKEVFENSENYAFDEFTGIDMIAENSHLKTININNYADIDTRYTRYKMRNDYNYDKQFFLWKEGKMYRIGINMDNSYDIKELIYLHFQKKKPRLFYRGKQNKLVIGSNGIADFDINKYKEWNKYCGKIFEIDERNRYYLKKLIAFFKSSRAQKIIFIKQKIF